MAWLDPSADYSVIQSRVLQHFDVYLFSSFLRLLTFLLFLFLPLGVPKAVLLFLNLKLILLQLFLYTLHCPLRILQLKRQFRQTSAHYKKFIHSDLHVILSAAYNLRLRTFPDTSMMLSQGIPLAKAIFSLGVY